MTDRFTVRAVVCFLGTATLLGLAGLIWLVGTTNVKDAALLAVVAGPTGTALGALGTMLASTRTIDAQPVTVVNESDDAVPVAAVPARRARGD